MATFVQLVSWTDQGVHNFRDTTKRADAYEEMLGALGASLKELFWTLGPYDIVAVVEAPDDETMTAASIKVAALGNVRTTTLRAFNKAEVERIVAKAQ
jgi:uncharacterized protein with GYD domain